MPPKIVKTVRVPLTTQTYSSSSGYRSSKMSVPVPDNDTDIYLNLPSGDSICLQYRIEGGTVDVCLNRPANVYNWSHDMKPAPRVGRNDEVREAVQLVIGFPEPLTFGNLPRHMFDVVSLAADKINGDVDDLDGLRVYELGHETYLYFSFGKRFYRIIFPHLGKPKTATLFKYKADPRNDPAAVGELVATLPYAPPKPAKKAKKRRPR